MYTMSPENAGTSHYGPNAPRFHRVNTYGRAGMMVSASARNEMMDKNKKKMNKKIEIEKNRSIRRRVEGRCGPTIEVYVYNI